MSQSKVGPDLASATEGAPEGFRDRLRPPQDDIQAEFLAAADSGNDAVLAMLLRDGAKIDIPDKRTGLTALHLAVGRDAVAAAQLLIAHGAKFLPDNLGRMPSAIAAECEVSEAMCDLIAEAEEKAEAV